MTFFPDIECKTLPLPHSNKEVIQNIAQHTNELNPDFRKEVQDFMTYLIVKAQTNGAKHGYQKGSIITGNIGIIGNYTHLSTLPPPPHQHTFPLTQLHCT